MMDIFVRVSEAFGQEVSVSKTKVMVSERLSVLNSSRAQPHIHVHSQQLEVVDSFVYLGSSVSWDGSMDGEIKRRVQRIFAAFSRWRSVLENRDIALHTRLMLFQSVIQSNGLYGCEVWHANENNFARLEAVHFHLLRRTIGPQVSMASWTEVLEFIRQVVLSSNFFPLEALAFKRSLRF